MAHQALSRETFDDIPIDSNPRRSSDPVCSINKMQYTHTNTARCCGGGHHGCGCGCKGCICRLTLFKDESNCEAYAGEGGRPGMPSPDVDLPDHASRYDSSSASVRTDDSRSLSNESFDNSFEARHHYNGHHTASASVNRAGHQFSEEDEDGHHAWADFVSPDLSHFEEDSSGMLIPGLMDNSALALHGSRSDIGQRSLLNSEYERSFTQPSASASQVLTGVGAGFEHHRNHFIGRPLRLAPECRHSTSNLICARCVQ